MRGGLDGLVFKDCSVVCMRFITIAEHVAYRSPTTINMVSRSSQSLDCFSL